MGELVRIFEPKRWTVGICYRADSGMKGAGYSIEELEELHDIVEAGPHWDTIASITIVLNRPSESHVLTLEQAEKL